MERPQRSLLGLKRRASKLMRVDCIDAYVLRVSSRATLHYSIYCTPHTTQHKPNNVLHTLHHRQCIPHNIPYTIDIVHDTRYTLHQTPYIIRYTITWRWSPSPPSLLSTLYAVPTRCDLHPFPRSDGSARIRQLYQHTTEHVFCMRKITPFRVPLLCVH